MDALNARIAESERLASQTRTATREVQAALAAARTVADQPDWGSLLSVIAARLGEDAVLSNCSLEPAEAAAVPSAPQNGAPGQKGQPAPIAARPSRYRLTLAGLARTQEAVSRLTLEYTNAHLFDSVNIVETRRSTFLDQPAVAFRIECAINEAPAGRSP